MSVFHGMETGTSEWDVRTVEQMRGTTQEELVGSLTVYPKKQ